jgi:hypothetical protein
MELKGQKGKHTHIIARVQYINCILLGYYATFHNKSLEERRREKNLESMSGCEQRMQMRMRRNEEGLSEAKCEED